MTVLITLSILMAPFAVAMALGWMAHRSAELRINSDQFRVSAPMRGRLSAEGSDAPRMQRELDAIRTRFERQRAWPRSGALGERR